jgi:thiol:disulfide interchange protein DsbD
MFSEKKRLPRALAVFTLALAAMAFAVPAFASAVVTKNVEASLFSNAGAIHPDQKFHMVLHLKLQPGWHTYWKNPGDSGLAPDLKWTLPRGFSVGETQFLAPERLQTGDLVDYGYSNHAWYLATVTAPHVLGAHATSILSLKARWLVCKDVCIPESGEFSLSLPSATQPGNVPSNEVDVVAHITEKLPVSLADPMYFSVADGKVNLSVPLDGIATHDIKNVEFFPDKEGFITASAKQTFDTEADRANLTLVRSHGKLPDNMHGLVSFYLENGERKDFEADLRFSAFGMNYHSGAVTAQLLLAILGGFILNFMPCVFPVLSLKALAIAKKAEKHASEVRQHSLVYTAGVVASFIALALLLVAVRAGGQSVGWGYQMQSPAFVTILAVIFFLSGLNLSGFFELPSFLGSFGARAAAKANLFGSFATGVLAVLVATPCTAPFMAPALGFALSRSVGVILIIFTGLGLGLALPFLLISVFPALISRLPKPGAWMLVFRQALAFPMYLCAVWLLWVLSREAGTEVAFIVMLGMVFLVFAIWLNRLKPGIATVAALLAAAFTVATAIDFMHTKPSSNAQTGTQKFSAELLDQLRAQQIPVFVDATADWCITCKVNESVALSSPKVKRAFAEKQIITLVADWTHGDADITEYLHSFGRSGVPIYVYYPPDGDPVILPQLLTRSIVLEAIR